jgi:hypothetical protein
LWIASGLMGVQAPGGRKAGLGLWCSPKDGADGPFTSRGRIASNDGVSLFADDDGSAYLCTGFGLLRKFKADMSGLDEAWGRYTLAWAQGIQVNYDCGWFLSKIGGKYIAQAIQVQGAYCSTYGIADSLKGPYRYIGVSHPHGGNSKLSQTKDGGWMQILFGNTDYYVPFEMSQGPRITSMVVDTSGGTVRIRME